MAKQKKQDHWMVILKCNSCKKALEVEAKEWSEAYLKEVEADEIFLIVDDYLCPNCGGGEEDVTESVFCPQKSLQPEEKTVE